jgi:hypothetical protein
MVSADALEGAWVTLPNTAAGRLQNISSTDQAANVRRDFPGSKAECPLEDGPKRETIVVPKVPRGKISNSQLSPGWGNA